MRSLFFVAMVLTTAAGSAQYIAEILPTPNGGGTAAGASGGQIVGGSFGPGGGPTLWDGPSHSFINLSPAGYDFAEVFGVGGGKQVGYGFINNDTRAIMWSGSPGSVVDLHPQGFLGSIAYGTDGTAQAGASAAVINQSHAALWFGSANSFIDLHPISGYDWSEAYDVQGNVQVGTAENEPVMWFGSAASMQLLPLPIGYEGSSASAIHGNQIVGSSAVNGNGHAMLWGTDGISVVDLTPPGWGSAALDTNGLNQVGVGGFGQGQRAVAWAGSSQSMIDLHALLPTSIVESIATGIDENGTIVGWGHVNGFGQVPLVWTPVPEPASALGLILGIGFLAFRKRRRRQ